MNIFSSNGMAMESPLHSSALLKTEELSLFNLPPEILAEVVIKLLGAHTTLDMILKEIDLLRLVNRQFNKLFTNVNAIFMQRILQTVRISESDEYLQDVINKHLLHSAVKGQARLVTILLQRGAQVNARGKYLGEIALHRAATNSHTETVKLLIASGADVNAQRKDGNTPLHNAILWGSAEIVQLLVAHGADASIESMSNQIAYNLSKSKEKQEAIDKGMQQLYLNTLL